jgi:hypothetical protein
MQQTPTQQVKEATAEPPQPRPQPPPQPPQPQPAQPPVPQLVPASTDEGGAGAVTTVAVVSPVAAAEAGSSGSGRRVMLRSCYDPTPKVIDILLGVGSSQQGFTLVGRQMPTRWAYEFCTPDGRVVSNKVALELAQANGAAAAQAPSLPRQRGRQKQERRSSASTLWFREMTSQAGWQMKVGGLRRSGGLHTPFYVWTKAGVTKRSALAVYNAMQPLSRPGLPRWMDPAIVAKTGTPRVEEDCDEEIEEEGEEEEVEVEVEVVVLKAEAVDEEGEVGGGAPHQREPAGLCLNKSDDEAAST